MNTSTSSNGDRPSFDAAALAVATAAGAITVFTTPGPYTWFDGIVGITLLVIIWAYEVNRPRNRLQRLALSMSTAFIFLLVWGLFWELIYSGLDGICSLNGQPYSPSSCEREAETAIPDLLIFGAWPIVTAVVFVLDWWRQERRKSTQHQQARPARSR